MGNSYFNMPLEKGELDALSGNGSESAVMRHSRLFDSLLHKLVKILDMDKLFGLSPRVIVLIRRAGM